MTSYCAWCLQVQRQWCHFRTVWMTLCNVAGWQSHPRPGGGRWVATPNPWCRRHECLQPNLNRGCATEGKMTYKVRTQTPMSYQVRTNVWVGASVPWARSTVFLRCWSSWDPVFWADVAPFQSDDPFRIFFLFKLIKYQSLRSMHHLFHVLHTRMHAHKSTCGRYLKTSIHIWWSRTWLAPLSIRTCFGGGGIGAGRTTYFWICFISILHCFRGAFVWYSAISLRFLGMFTLLVSSSLPPSLSFLSLIRLILESRELMEPPSESGLWPRWPRRKDLTSSPYYNKK